MTKQKWFTGIFMLCTVALNAQVKIGVKSAYNYGSAKAVYNGVKQSAGYTSGFGIGGVVKIPFDGPLHFSPSVMINRRGFIINNPAGSTNKKEEYGITYLDLIPALSADFEKGDNAFSITAGPVFGFTNFGKLKITDNSGVTGSQKIKFGYNNYGWFDLGLNGSIAYRFNKTMIEAGYYMGLANINNNEEHDARNMQHRVASLGIVYFFKETAH